MISIQEIIHRYTEADSPEYKLTNNLLRAYNNPTEAFYCQPYLKALFESIKSLYIKQKPTMGDSLICYRGATASTEEIENYKNNCGKIIQSLGFLSTSTRLSIGEYFAKNLMFVITIKEE